MMTRSYKLNDPGHLADGIIAREHPPRYFGKSGPTDIDPRKTKKDGGGKRNWGRSGDEMRDYGYTFTNTRRYSNSSTQEIAEFRTKFETVEDEPHFEERIHDVSKDTVFKVESSSSSKSDEAHREP